MLQIWPQGLALATETWPSLLSQPTEVQTVCVAKRENKHFAQLAKKKSN